MLRTEVASCADDGEWRNVSDQDLMREIGIRFRACAQSFVDLAEIVGVAARRGLDVQATIDNPLLLDILRKIESHQIIPELAEKYLHAKNGLFHKLKNLPIDDQRQIVENGTVLIVVRRGVEFDSRRISVGKLQPDQIRLVFGSGRIRSETEMIAILEDSPEPIEDAFAEAMVEVKIAAVIDLSKADRKKLMEKAEKSGGMSAFIKKLIQAKL